MHLYLYQVDSSAITIWTGPFAAEWVLVSFFLFYFLPCFIEIPVFNPNSIDPDQIPVTPDLRLHHLAMSLLWDARQK